MDLFDEDILKTKKRKQVKASTLILIAIVILSILCVITFIAIVYIKGSILKITVDGNKVADLQDIFIIEENNKVYMPIRRMAEYLGYGAYTGEYTTRSEDDLTKCYIETEEEVVSFTLDSNILTRVVDGQTQQIKITEPIKEINGELCITAEGAQDAFNLKFYYDVDKNDIYIETLTYLYNYYSQMFQMNGYMSIENESVANKTAILDGMLIVKSKNNYYGVVTIGGETILETKYDNIEYLRKTSDFLVTSRNKMGIISKNKKTKVELIYDNIQSVTNKNDIFYVVKDSNLYGLLDVDGKTIIYPEYEQIGIDVSAYSQNGVTNGYILYNKLVPIKRNNQWGLVDTEGNKVTDFIYDSFGCPNGKNNLYRTYGVIEVLDYNFLVVRKGDKYNLIDMEGKTLFGDFILDSVYITISEGKNIYYITSGETTKELISFLQENGVSKPTLLEQ